LIKEVYEAIAANSVEEAKKALHIAIPVIHRAAAKGAFHQKNASRKVSRLTKHVNALGVLGAQSAS